MVVCPQLQTNGACSDASCSLNHDVRICEDCNVLCPSSTSYNSHIAGKKHRRKMLGLSTLFHCPLCHVKIYGPTAWSQHVSGGPHRRTAGLQGVSPEVEAEGAGDIDGQTYCGLCDKHIIQHQWSSHVRGVAHHNKERLSAYRTAIEEAQKNKHGVTVSEGIDFGIVDVAEAQETVSVKFTMETTVPTSRIVIVDYKLSVSSATSSPYAIFWKYITHLTMSPAGFQSQFPVIP